MEIVITIVVTIAVIGIISAFILIRPNQTRRYNRMVEDDYGEPDAEPASMPVARRRSQRFPGAGGDSLTSLLIKVLRGAIGLAAVGALAYIYTSTQSAVGVAGLNAAEMTRIYTAGIFKAVIALGITAGAYIFTKFAR
jgi:hypothetical protein